MVTPNPSIERTSQRLRLCAAAHVERWAAGMGRMPRGRDSMRLRSSIFRRRCWIRRSLAAALAMLVFVFVTAADRAFAGPATPFDKGVLWRISKGGTPDSYAFGTIHIADPRVGISRPVADALDRSRTLALELIERAANKQILELEQLPDGHRLKELIGEDLYSQVRSTLAAQDIPFDVIERLKPWAAMMKVARAPARIAEPSLDQKLVAVARARGLKIMPLESLDEQVGAFDALPIDTQVALLKHALADRSALEAGVEITLQAWLRGDLAGLAQLNAGSSDRFTEMGRHHKILKTHIIHDRNVQMHYRLFMPLRSGRVFIAVGALHLYGRKGLLSLIAQDGYRITRFP